jgi:hypothetical protein
MKALVVVISMLMGVQCFSQNKKNINRTIKLSGIVVTDDSLSPVPAVTIKILKTDSIEFNYFFSIPSEANGYFVLMVKPGDLLGFKKEGFMDSQYAVSDTLKMSSYTITQYIQRKTGTTDTVKIPDVSPKKRNKDKR